jgi:hypothetical protein
VRVGLVGCVKQKAASALAAEDLYTSPLFRGRRAYVRASCDRWLILSAKHGLVHPADVIAPYDETLTTASTKARQAWSARVLAALVAELDQLEGITFEIHADAAYRDFGLVDGLRERGAQVEVPAAGLNQGEQLAFYAGWSLAPANGTALAGRDRSSAPLASWLEGASSPVTLSFQELEHIIGQAFPPSARRHRAWWANSPSRTLARQWLAAGWRAEQVDLAGERVRLAR